MRWGVNTRILSRTLERMAAPKRIAILMIWSVLQYHKEKYMIIPGK
jgi:hypothetical protein